MARSRREVARFLTALAQGQSGYFTVKQAKTAGYSDPLLKYHLTAGNFERIEHGLYRLVDVPPGEDSDWIRLSLWSRNRSEEPQAVVSHDSALVLHGLSELLPNRIHLTVPPGFRKAAPRGCVLHKARLETSDIEDRGGFGVTTPVRTLLDAATGGVSQEQLAKAVGQALARGLVRRSDLMRVLKENPRFERLGTVLKTRKRG